MTTSKTKLAMYEFWPDIKTLYWEWLDTTKGAKWDEIQKAMIEYAAKALECKAESHIINEKKQGFTFVPATQSWIDQNISIQTVASGCRRFGLVQSDNLFKAVAVQQIFDEENTSKIQFKRFKTLDEAKEWVAKYA